MITRNIGQLNFIIRSMKLKKCKFNCSIRLEFFYPNCGNLEFGCLREPIAIFAGRVIEEDRWVMKCSEKLTTSYLTCDMNRKSGRTICTFHLYDLTVR